MTEDDQLHARAIEKLMCDFTLDLEDLSSEYGPCAYRLRPCLEDMESRFKPFARLVGVVAVMACATAHYWAREINAMGHTVRLVPPAYVKPFVKRQP